MDRLVPRKLHMQEPKETPKKLHELKQERPLQLSLFEEIVAHPADSYSHTVRLYDAIPKYFWGRLTEEERRTPQQLERKFVFEGRSYTVVITPAIVKDKDGVVRIYFPGRREELIEDALRKLAAERGRGLLLDDQVGLVFTLYELQEELKRHGHSYSITELKEGLTIMSRTNLRLDNQSGDNLDLRLLNGFALSDRDAWKAQGRNVRSYIQFNPLVTKSIMLGTYRRINYKKLMSVKRDLSRYMLKRLSHNYKQASMIDPFRITLTTILRDSGMGDYGRLRDAHRQVMGMWDELRELGVIERVEAEATRGKPRNTLVEVTYTAYPGSDFVKDTRAANKFEKDIADTLKPERLTTFRSGQR